VTSCCACAAPPGRQAQQPAPLTAIQKFVKSLPTKFQLKLVKVGAVNTDFTAKEQKEFKEDELTGTYQLSVEQIIALTDTHGLITTTEE
jgi:hypothetical protein